LHQKAWQVSLVKQQIVRCSVEKMCPGVAATPRRRKSRLVSPIRERLPLATRRRRHPANDAFYKAIVKLKAISSLLICNISDIIA